MTLISALRKFVILVMVLPLTAGGDELRTEWGGHTKLAATWQSFPDDSILRDAVGSSAFDGQGDLRLNLELRKSGWSFDANYQLAVLAGDSLDIVNQLPPAAGPLQRTLP
ncbi:MAG: hypothetical protein AAFN50_13695, partial [Pseudomonadota bacterium]